MTDDADFNIRLNACFVSPFILCQSYGLKVSKENPPPPKGIRGTAHLTSNYYIVATNLYPEATRVYSMLPESYHYFLLQTQFILIFHIKNYNMQEAKSTNSTVVLTNLSLEATGLYKCEIIGEGPLFPTVHGVGNLTVIDLPESAPILTGLKKTYQLGEPVNVNCTSQLSKPAATLEWHINRRKVESELELVRYDPIVDQASKLETAVLGLAFTARRHHFIRGKMDLKCVARIAKVYFQSQENTAIETNYEKMTQAEFSRDKKGFFLFGSGGSCLNMGPLTLAFGWILLMIVYI
ncbi:unnamed protein product, partial [Meganyctiphanes norvegica]